MCIIFIVIITIHSGGGGVHVSYGVPEKCLARPGARFVPRNGILEPQYVRYERGVPQQEQFRHAPQHDHRKVGRQDEVRQQEPQRTHYRTDEGTDQHLGKCVIEQVDPAEADEKCGRPTDGKHQQSY
uniref:Secreted protein n=1 Tax=Anopheles melas TaxID=34690 RepID=A0A182UIE2_9DIPT